MKNFFKPTTKFIVIAILTLTLTLSWSPNSLGQIPLFTTPNNNQPTQSHPWDLNKAYICGKFWCSDVYIYDDSTKIETSILTPELTLTVLKELNQSSVEVAQKVEQRAKLVQRVFETIFEDIVSSKTISEVPYIPDWQFWLPTTVKSLHPWTPKIEVGFQNKQTVIYIPAQPELGLASQTIVTVTQVDAKVNGKTVEELAEAWRTSIRLSFSNALWGHELDLQHPQWRWGISGAIMGGTLGLIWLIHLICSFLRKWNNQLRRRLNELTDSLAVDPEATSSQNREKNVSDILDSPEELDDKTFEQNDASVEPVKKTVPSPSLQTRIFNFIKSLPRKKKWISSKFHISKQKLFLQRQTLIKQERNFCQLCLRLMCILEILILSLGLTVIVLIFRQTRFISVYLFKRTLILLILWIGLIFADKLGDFAIDYLLNRWASEAQVAAPSSNRYTLRANTYSQTLKRATTFFTIVLLLYLSIWLIGINPSILAGAGLVTVALAFLSRNLIEDLLNGILILCTDRYAIGDVIDVGGGMAGTVEDINLFITSLRNLDGQLIAIPNSKISAVINNTKYWSRVNFTIKIAWDEDINKAIEVMTQVANQMQSEPEWEEKFLEPAEILGVDEVSNEGIVIHLLIKTQPKEQWSVGREFRRRVKQALDEAGISLGIPHHKISVIHSQKDNSN
ncbi:MAG: mechanosensitive ion channel family protein [Xenococcaceae cyanobacterium]